MNAITVTQPRLQLPTEATAMMHLATQLSASRTIPSVFQKSPADCFNVLSVCMRFGFDWYSTIWECSLIKNRLFYSGKMVQAMLNSSGYLAERLSFEYFMGEPKEDGSEDLNDRHVIVRGRIQGETSPRIITLYVAEAKTGNEYWTKTPDQMLAYAGARIWGRRHLPEVLLGLMFDDEEEEYVANMKDVTPPKEENNWAPAGHGSIRPKPPEAAAKAIDDALRTAKPPIAKPIERAREEPHGLEPPELITNVPENAEQNRQTWRAWCEKFIALARTSITLDEVDSWLSSNYETLGNLSDVAPKTYAGVVNSIELHKMALRGPGQKDAAP
jgi:hypothetical protein